MARCVGRSQRTGERCKRSAAAGASTCYYHGDAKRASARGQGATRLDGRKPDRAALKTKALSKRTWDDFESLFAEGTGWGRCACLFALQAKRSSAKKWAEQRA